MFFHEKVAKPEPGYLYFKYFDSNINFASLRVHGCIVEPAVILPKIKDNAPTQQIIKSTLMIGVKHIKGKSGHNTPKQDLLC